MPTKYAWIFLGLFFLSGCRSTSESVVFSEVKAAYRSQNFGVAAEKLTPLARRGHPEAQYALGYLYVKGLGVQQNQAMARFWIAKAAEQHHLAAQEAMRRFAW